MDDAWNPQFTECRACGRDGTCDQSTDDRAFGALASFEGVDRRLNLLYETDNLKIWDDFAHHPTAIEATLNALRNPELVILH